MRNFASALCCVMSLLLFSDAMAQIRVVEGGPHLVLGKDTLCFRYEFMRGDTLEYLIESRDSIDIDQRSILLKVRNERLRIVCDSVVDGKFFLTLNTLRATEYQTTGADTVFRPGHPWVGITTHLVLDKLGRRHGASSSASEALLCPGGAFQPLRLPILDSSCARQNQSWVAHDTVLYVENGVPYPQVDQLVLWRVGDYLDTLGRSTQTIVYSLSSKGLMDMTASQLGLQTSAAIAEVGRMVFDRTLNLPLVTTTQQDNRFSVFSNARPTLAGKHLMVVTMVLDQLRSPSPTRRWSAASANAPVQRKRKK